MSATTALAIVMVAWLAIGVVTGTTMGRRGHDAFTWMLLGATLGPLVVPLALSTHRRTGPPPRPVTRVWPHGPPPFTATDSERGSPPDRSARWSSPGRTCASAVEVHRNAATAPPAVRVGTVVSVKQRREAADLAGDRRSTSSSQKAVQAWVAHGAGLGVAIGRGWATSCSASLSAPSPAWQSARPKTSRAAASSPSPSPAAPTSTKAKNSAWPRSRTSPSRSCRIPPGNGPGTPPAATAAGYRCPGTAPDPHSASSHQGCRPGCPNPTTGRP
jgi:hypothetical protein